MKPWMVGPAAACACLAAPFSAEAQENVEFTATPYIWVVGVKGDVGGGAGRPPANLDVDFGDIADHFDGALMLQLDGRIGRIGAFVDVDFLRLSGSRRVDVNAVLSAGSDVELEILGGTAGAYWRFGSTETTAVDIVAGARVNSLDLDAALRLNAQVVNATRKQEWWDPVVGARIKTRLTDRIGLVGYADYGGFGVSSDAVYQVYGAISYDFTPGFSMGAGYRYYVVDYAEDDFKFDVSLGGPLIGAALRF